MSKTIDDILSDTRLDTLKEEAYINAFISEGDKCFLEFDFDNALEHYLSALKVRPKQGNTVVLGNRIMKTQDFDVLFKLGSLYLANAKAQTDMFKSKILQRKPEFMLEHVHSIDSLLKKSVLVFSHLSEIERRRTLKRSSKLLVAEALTYRAELYSDLSFVPIYEDVFVNKARECAKDAEEIFCSELSIENPALLFRHKTFSLSYFSNPITKQLLRHDPKIDDINYYLGRLYMTGLIGDTALANQHFRKVRSASRFGFDARMRRAHILSRDPMGEPVSSDAARNIYQGLLEEDSTNHELHVNLADQYMCLNDFDKALEHFQKAFRFGVSKNQRLYVKSLLGMHHCYFRLSKDGPPQYKNMYLRAQYGLLRRATQMYEESGDILLAISNYKLIAESNHTLASEKALAYRKLGEYGIKLRIFDEALDYLRHSIRYECNDPQANFALGIVNYRLGRFSDASKFFHKAYAIHPMLKHSFETLEKRVAALCMRGFCMINTGSKDQGLDELRCAVNELSVVDGLEEKLTLEEDGKIMKLNISDVAQLNFKKDQSAKEEFEKSLFIFQRLDKPTLTSVPINTVNYKGETYFVTLALKGLLYNKTVNHYVSSEGIDKHAIKVISIMARIHHEVNREYIRTTFKKERVFDFVSSVTDLLNNKVFDCKTYEPLTSFNGIGSMHPIRKNIISSALTLDDILYSSDNISNGLLYGVVQGDFHSGNVMVVDNLDYDPKIRDRNRPYLSVIDNAQAKVDLFFSDIYDFLEDVRQRVHETSIAKRDLVRLYFLLRSSIRYDKEEYKGIVFSIFRGDKESFDSYTRKYYRPEFEAYVDMYYLYSAVRDTKSISMFKAYEHDVKKSPTAFQRTEYASKVSYHAKSMFKGLTHFSLILSEEAGRIPLFDISWRQYFELSKMNDYFSFSKYPERDYSDRGFFTSLFKSA